MTFNGECILTNKDPKCIRMLFTPEAYMVHVLTDDHSHYINNAQHQWSKITGGMCNFVRWQKKWAQKEKGDNEFENPQNMWPWYAD
jgi:hypothetical protein